VKQAPTTDNGGGHFKERDLMYLDSYDEQIEDEQIEDNDPIHEENETATEGARFVKKKHGRTADDTTAPVNPLDTEALVLFQPAVEDEDVVEEAEPELPRAAAPKTAKQQIKEKLNAALADFGKLSKPPKEAANDNFKPVVSWPLMDQLTRSTFEPDRERRTKLIVTARYIRDLIDMAGADSMGMDCDVQRTESGKVYFEHGQTLDRKKRTYDHKNDEQGAERYDGSVRTAKKSIPIGNSLNRDDPFPLRVIAAREELSGIIAAVGPLWPSLVAAISENATLTDVGFALGAKGAQAPVGSVIIRLALTAAVDALDRFNRIKDEPRRPTPMPNKSRGSFLNQSSGPVIKLAA
jgi:hypothetical protein